MYELPSRDDVKRCEITGGVIMGQSAPILYDVDGTVLDESPPSWTRQPSSTGW